jgi:hypothetical protein
MDRRRVVRSSGVARAGGLLLVVVLLCAATVSAVMARPAPSGTAAAHGAAAAQLRQWAANAAEFQRFTLLYASGDPGIISAVTTAQHALGLADWQIHGISAAVRLAWVQMMGADPATVGRPQTRPHYAAQQAVLDALNATLRTLIGSREPAFLALTHRPWGATLATIVATEYRPHGGSSVAIASFPQLVLVYATSFSIPGKPTTLPYVALPDAYVKDANLGLTSSIPTIYQPYYTATPSHPYTVDIANANTSGAIVAPAVPALDVGPWNEDDNWWDPFRPAATVPASCPVSSQLVSPTALTNALVDSICPGPAPALERLRANWRRVAYYLLYQHDGLPFFQPAGYSPTGSFKDTTNWPVALPTYCPESAAASVTDDGFNCAPGLAGYNAHAGAWGRNNAFNAPITNQSAIDLSPAVDAALGWTYPSSGFIVVTVSRLP